MRRRLRSTCCSSPTPSSMSVFFFFQSIASLARASDHSLSHVVRATPPSSLSNEGTGVQRNQLLKRHPCSHPTLVKITIHHPLLLAPTARSTDGRFSLALLSSPLSLIFLWAFYPPSLSPSPSLPPSIPPGRRYQDNAVAISNAILLARRPQPLFFLSEAAASRET